MGSVWLDLDHLACAHGAGAGKRPSTTPHLRLRSGRISAEPCAPRLLGPLLGYVRAESRVARKIGAGDRGDHLTRNKQGPGIIL